MDRRANYTQEAASTHAACNELTQQACAGTRLRMKSQRLGDFRVGIKSHPPLPDAPLRLRSCAVSVTVCAVLCIASAPRGRLAAFFLVVATASASIAVSIDPMILGGGLVGRSAHRRRSSAACSGSAPWSSAQGE